MVLQVFDCGMACSDVPRAVPSTDIWVGSSLGILKGEVLNHQSLTLSKLTAINVSDGKFTNHLPTGMSVKDTTRRMEILDMCWEYNNEEKVCKSFSYVHM